MSFTARRSDAQWRSAIMHNEAVARVSSLDGACQVTHGMYFWPLEPRHPGNDYSIETIAHGLCGKSRWSGFTKRNDRKFSVAQHSVHVADIVNLNRKKLVPGGQWGLRPSPALCGLLHDGSEAWIDDIVRPVKYKLTGYTEVEKSLQMEIYARHNCPIDGIITEAVRRVDNMMIFLERDELMGKPVVPYSNEFDHPRITIHDVVPDFRIWSPEEAYERFIDKFEEIVRGDGNLVPAEYARGERFML